MKKIVIFASIALMLFACKPSEMPYTVIVNVEVELPVLEQDPRLMLYTEDQTIADVAEIQGGMAHFTGQTSGLNYAYIGTYSETGQSLPLCRFILEDGAYLITLYEDDKNPYGFTAQVVASQDKTQYVSDSLERAVNNLAEELGAIRLYKEYTAALQEQDKVKTDSLRNIFIDIHNQCNTIKERYIAEHPTSRYALIEAASNIEELPLDSAKKVEARFASVRAYRNNNQFLKIKEAVEKKSAAGTQEE